MERICPLFCEGIGNETLYISECKNKEMIKVCNECMDPSTKTEKIWESYQQNNSVGPL